MDLSRDLTKSDSYTKIYNLNARKQYMLYKDINRPSCRHAVNDSSKHPVLRYKKCLEQRKQSLTKNLENN